MEALAAYEADVCSSCGWHHSLSDDLNNVFTFDEKVCNTCRGSDRYARMQHDADEKMRERLGDNSPAGTPLPTDGRKTYMRMLAPAEVDQIRARRTTRGKSQADPTAHPGPSRRS